MVTFDRLLDIVYGLSLLTGEEDDRMRGVYIDESLVINGRQTRVVRAKGSTLALIADARQALKDAGRENGEST